MYDIPVHVAQTCLTTHQAGTRVWYNGFMAKFSPNFFNDSDSLDSFQTFLSSETFSNASRPRAADWPGTPSSTASSSSEHCGFHGIFAMMTSLNPKMPRKDDQDWEKPPWMHECSIIFLFQNFQKHGVFRVFLDFRVVFPTLTWFPSFLFCMFTYVYGELSRLDQALGGSASDSRGGWSRWTWESRLQEAHQVAGTANDAVIKSSSRWSPKMQRWRIYQLGFYWEIFFFDLFGDSWDHWSQQWRWRFDQCFFHGEIWVFPQMGNPHNHGFQYV